MNAMKRIVLLGICMPLFFHSAQTTHAETFPEVRCDLEYKTITKPVITMVLDLAKMATLCPNFKKIDTENLFICPERSSGAKNTVVCMPYYNPKTTPEAPATANGKPAPSKKIVANKCAVKNEEGRILNEEAFKKSCGKYMVDPILLFNKIKIGLECYSDTEIKCLYGTTCPLENAAGKTLNITKFELSDFSCWL